VTEYRLISEPRADLDVEAAFEWYEKERPGLGLEFLDELRAAYNRIVDNPFKYQQLRSGSAVRYSDAFPTRSTLRLKTMLLSSVLCWTLVAIRPSGSAEEAPK
jgi:plasmid stabilization system protein ParE